MLQELFNLCLGGQSVVGAETQFTHQLVSLMLVTDVTSLWVVVFVCRVKVWDIEKNNGLVEVMF